MNLQSSSTIILLAGLAGLFGCASSRPPESPPIGKADTIAVRNPGRETALQHFIAGSIFESKGEYAKAVLEYQDALRYDREHAVIAALSRSYAALGKLALAADAGREAVRLAPENTEYRRQLGEIYASSYELDSAAAQFRAIIAIDSSDIDPWFNLARMYQGRKPLQALEVYETVLRKFGPRWEVLAQIAEINNALQRHDRTAQALKALSELDPGNVEIKKTYAESLIRAGDLETGRIVLEELLEARPDDGEIRTELGVVSLMKSDYERARREFAPILESDTAGIETKLRIGEAYFAQIQRDSSVAPRAIEIFNRIRSEHRDDWRPYWFLGAIGGITGDDSLAESNFRRVTELASWNADAWVYLSGIFLQRDRFAEVIPILEAAVKIVPDDFRVNLYLGLAYNRVGRNLDAIQRLERARSINPRDVSAIGQLALVYETLGRYEESDRLYEQAMKLEPANDLILNNFAYSLSERGIRLDEALEWSARAVQARPENSSYLDTMGWIYFKLGDYAKAEYYIKKAIDNGDASAVVHEHLGDVYFMMNDRERALEQWRIALRMDESNERLRSKIERGAL